MKKQTKMIAGGVAVVAAAVGGYFIYKKVKENKEKNATTTEEPKTEGVRGLEADDLQEQMQSVNRPSTF